jgi:hypothetical protein
MERMSGIIIASALLWIWFDMRKILKIKVEQRNEITYTIVTTKAGDNVPNRS